MSIANGVKSSKLRRKITLNHRQFKYETALDMLIAGTCSTGYVTMRANKLKQIGGLKWK